MQSTKNAGRQLWSAPVCSAAFRSAIRGWPTRWLLLLAILLIGSPVSEAVGSETITLDKRHLSVCFEIEEFWLWRIEGSFGDALGELALDAKELAKSRLKVVVQTGSINTGSAHRDNSLRSKDFFDVAQHPLMIFESTRIELVNEHAGIVSGNLNMLGVTRPIRLKFELSGQPEAISLQTPVPIMSIQASGVVRRSEWGMTALIPTISDEVHLKIRADVAN